MNRSSNKPQPTPRRTFRKLTQAEVDRASELARLGASDREIITVLGCNPRNLTPRMRADLHRHRAERLIRLKAKLFELALKGNSNATLYLMREQDHAETTDPRKPRGSESAAPRNRAPDRLVLVDAPALPAPDPDTDPS